MLSSEVAQSLKSDGHFSDIVVGIALSHAMLDFSGKANISIHGLGEDDTTRGYEGNRTVACRTVKSFSHSVTVLSQCAVISET